MSSNDSPENNINTSGLLSGRVWLIVCGLIAVFAALSRILLLDEKPFHHDESLHGYYSERVAQGFPHEYSALLHGPVLYYLVGGFIKFFGATDFTVRMPAAICGVLIVLLPLFWRRRIGTAAAISIALFVLLSPTFMYFGRFLREDAFNSLWIALSLAGFFGFRWSGQPWMAVCCSTFLAFQFCNKENSYLHVFIWLSGALAISLLAKVKGKAHDVWPADVSLPKIPSAERVALWVNCVLVFAVIYVLFYSSFFRHSKGSMHGIIDGLYRESLLYWWEQNQKRRIDGPFDYHSPLFFNYEFALIPALIAAWFRTVRLSAIAMAESSVRFPFSWLKRFRFIVALSGLLLGFVFFAPRVGLTNDGCTISEFCLNQLLPGSLSEIADKIAHGLHIAHSRHLFQMIATVLLGAVAVLASTSIGRKLDAFLWWWTTGAIGIYSYVGEKVPWLLLYILLPIVVLAGLEIGRSVQRSELWIDSLSVPRSPSALDAMRRWNEGWSHRAGRWVVGLSLLLLLFAGGKAIRLSFARAANPEERLVFTQTTPLARSLRLRWSEMASLLHKTPKITMHGDATWPYAWYVRDFPGHDFVKPASPEAAASFDAIFLDLADTEYARQQLTAFDVYKIPLRHWWVPQANPRFSEILEYFLTSRPYPRELRSAPQEIGFGDTSVLYLENRGKNRFFESAVPIPGVERIAEAGRVPQSNQIPLKEVNSVPEPVRRE